MKSGEDNKICKSTPKYKALVGFCTAAQAESDEELMKNKQMAKYSEGLRSSS